MNKSIDEILKKLYPNEDTKIYEPRFNILYGMVFELAHPSEYSTIKKEIELCESEIIKNTHLERDTYEKISPVMLLQMYFEVSFIFAQLRVEKKTSIVCAKYLEQIFSEFLETDFISKERRKLCRRNISEALLDFAYASGGTDNMSFRLYHLLEGRNKNLN